MSDEPITGFLICAPADSPIAPVGAIFDKACSRCTRPVMIAVTGQRSLKKNPGLSILCMVCFFETRDPALEIGLAGTPEEIISEANSAVPNLRRHRN